MHLASRIPVSIAWPLLAKCSFTFCHRASSSFSVIAKAANRPGKFLRSPLKTLSTQNLLPRELENPNNDVVDTIYALSTAPGRAAIAVIRISGPACLQIYGSLCPEQQLPRPRVATLRTLRAPAKSNNPAVVLDPQALLLYFRGPQTVTGEDVLELHLHGGPAIVKAVLNAIPVCVFATKEQRTRPSIRYAEPGEFTRRAFHNARLDLVQVEALSDALSAETEQQRRVAIQSSANGLTARYERWRQLLLHARAEMEALIDFAEDQDFDESADRLMSSTWAQVSVLKTELRCHVENACKGELLRDGISLALLGSPNAGKSSLLNIIVGREAAIVNSEAGTTRDVMDIHVDIGGWLCRLGDMAGLRQSSAPAELPAGIVGAVEKEGMRRAKARALSSDVVLVLVSLESTPSCDGSSLHLNPELIDAVQGCKATGKQVVVAINKTDTLCARTAPRELSRVMAQIRKILPFVAEEDICAISCLEAGNPGTKAEDPGNIQHLLRSLQRIFDAMTKASTASGGFEDRAYWQTSLAVSHRQRQLLQQCSDHMDDYLSYTGYYERQHGEPLSSAEVDVAVAAEHLRAASNCLAKTTGKAEGADVEEVLGAVFEKFCVGK